MASIPEMMAYAEYMGQVNNPAAGVVNNAIKSFEAGRAENKTFQLEQAKRERELNTYNLDTILKLIDIKDKAQKMEIEAKNAKIQENMAKGMGFLENTPEEATNARATANTGLGVTPTTPNTTQGKVSKIAEDYVMLPMIGSKGWSMRWGKKTKGAGLTPSQDINLQMKKRQLATQMAVNKKIQSMGKNFDPILYPSGKVPVTEDEIMAQIPLAESYISKDMGKFNEQIRKEKAGLFESRFDLGDLDLGGDE